MKGSGLQAVRPLGLRVWGLRGFRGLGFRGLGFRVCGLEFRVSGGGLEFRA